MQQNHHHKLILLCARTTMSADISRQVQAIIGQEVNWRSLVVEAHQAGIAPLLWLNLKSFAGVPQETVKTLEAIYYNNLARNVFLSEELKQICRVFAENQIDLVPIKGVVLADLVYGNVALRQISDLDILVRAADVPRSLDLLSSSGFSYNKNGAVPRRDVLLSKIRTDVPYTLELHWKFKDSFLKFPEETIWNHLVPYSWQGIDIKIPSRELMLLHLVHHLHCHSYPLKILVDVSETLRAFEDSIDWDQLFRFARDFGLARSLAIALHSVSSVLQQPIPDPVNQEFSDSKARRWLSLIVDREHWFFSSIARKVQDHGYWSVAFSGLFTDGNYGDLFKAYWTRTKFWFSRRSHQFQRAGNDVETSDSAIH